MSRGLAVFGLALSLLCCASAKTVGEEFWNAAQSIRAARETIKEAIKNEHGVPEEVEGANAAAFAAESLLEMSEGVVADLRDSGAPPPSHKKKLALSRMLNRQTHGHRLRHLRRLRSWAMPVSAAKDYEIATKELRKAQALVKVAAWDAERKGTDAAARAAAVVVVDEAKRVYQLTQDAQSKHKDVTNKVAPKPKTGTTVWTKSLHKHCRHHKLDRIGSHYGTLKAAQVACVARANCKGVYQSGCAGFHFYLCDAEYHLENSGGSCVYEKDKEDVPEALKTEDAPEEPAAAPEKPVETPPVKVAKPVVKDTVVEKVQSEGNSLVDEAVAEVTTAAKNAEEVAQDVFGTKNAEVTAAVKEVEKASEDLQHAVKDSRLPQQPQLQSQPQPQPQQQVTASSVTVQHPEKSIVPVAEKVEKSLSSQVPPQSAPVQTDSDMTDADTNSLPQKELKALGAAFDSPTQDDTASAVPVHHESTTDAEADLEHLVEKMNSAPEDKVAVSSEDQEAKSAPKATEASEEPVQRTTHLSPTESRVFNTPEDMEDAQTAAEAWAHSDASPSAAENFFLHDGPSRRLRAAASAAAEAASEAAAEASPDAPRHRHLRANPFADEIDSLKEAFGPSPKADNWLAAESVPTHQFAFEKAVGMTVEPGSAAANQDASAGSSWFKSREKPHHKHGKHHHGHKRHHSFEWYGM